MIGSWRSTEPQVDASGVKGLQGGELLGYDEGSVIGEHDAARAHSHRGRGGGQMLDEDSGSGTRDGGDGVVFGDPEPVIPQALSFDGEHRRLPESLRGRRTARDGREVKNREGDHVRIYLKGGQIGPSPPKGLSLNASTRRVARDETDGGRSLTTEVALAAAVFVAMCLVVLMRSAQLLEPDDYAYRASIIALSQGHLLLTNAQYFALNARLSVHGGPGIEQWVHLRNGKWVSQKNPGYPFFAVIFQWLHALRAAPLFYGAFGCAGLFYGARAWLGRWGGVYVVALYCFSGAALLFAWRATMPTFTDASLIAGAAGLLLGALLRRDDPPTRRFLLGALAFLALDGAVFIRYTDVVVLVVALIAVIGCARVCRVMWSQVLGWCAVVAVFGVFDLVINHVLYGGIFTTGYRSGIVTFRASAIAPNLERMPSRLVESMPMAVLALIGVAWIVARYFSRPRRGPSHRGTARRDALVALALGVGWLALWGLYSAYTWTVGQTLGPGISHPRGAFLRTRPRADRASGSLVSHAPPHVGGGDVDRRACGTRPMVLRDAGQRHHRGAPARPWNYSAADARVRREHVTLLTSEESTCRTVGEATHRGRFVPFPNRRSPRKK